MIDTIITNEKRTRRENGELVKRSVVKTLSWRIIGTFDTILISYLVTGKFVYAFSIGGVELVTKMMLYFVHERAWNKINWGK